MATKKKTTPKAETKPVEPKETAPSAPAAPEKVETKPEEPKAKAPAAEKKNEKDPEGLKLFNDFARWVQKQSPLPENRMKHVRNEKGENIKRPEPNPQVFDALKEAVCKAGVLVGINDLWSKIEDSK